MTLIPILSKEEGKYKGISTEQGMARVGGGRVGELFQSKVL